MEAGLRSFGLLEVEDARKRLAGLMGLSDRLKKINLTSDARKLDISPPCLISLIF